MINWYSNKKIGIYFSDIPLVGVRYVLPSMADEEKRGIKKYPFICKKELQVKLVDYKKKKHYKFTVPKGYCYDGASIPRFFWRVIGSSTDNQFLIPALIHDVLCEHHNYVDNDRAFSTNVFNALLEVSGVGKLKRFCMKNSVGLFQTVCSSWK